MLLTLVTGHSDAYPFTPYPTMAHWIGYCGRLGHLHPAMAGCAMADNQLLTLCMISAWQRLAYQLAHAKAAATQGDQTNDQICSNPELLQWGSNTPR
jgi:hypothetical protein